MSTQISSKYGGRLLIKIGLVLFFIGEIIYFLGESQGDFANGILFFIDSQMNMYFLAFIILYFSTLYFLGIKTSQSIVAKRKNLTAIGIFFGICSAILITIYFGGYAFLLNNSIDPEYNKRNQGEIVRIFIQNFIVISICMVAIWIWAANRIARKMPRTY